MSSRKNLASFFLTSTLCLVSAALAPPVLCSAGLNDGAQTVVLESGNRLTGKVVKRTDKGIFLDIGYTIIEIPLEEVDRLLEEATPSSEKSAQTEGKPKPTESSEVDSIFYTADLEPGTVKEKAREVSESVVHVLCLGKRGSGFVINDEEGFVVTNFHVIEREQNISVAMYMRGPNGLRKVRKDKVRIVAFNPFFDLALLKVEDLDDVKLRKAFLGDYSRVRVGDPVFAIGNPLGLERTVSEGIVSSRNRALQGMLAIQTTAAINPGNSGGPLFNNQGEVIGVTSSTYFGANNLGFAIPVHYVKDFLRNREAFAFDRDNPNTGIRYLRPPSKRRPERDKDREDGTVKNQKNGAEKEF